MLLSHVMLALLIILVWGFNFIAIKVGVGAISPLLLITMRFFLTSIPAVFFFKRPAIPFKMVAFYGIFMFAVQHTLLFIGIHTGVTPGLASLLGQVQVFFTIILGMLFFREVPTLWQVIGGLIAFTGIALVAVNVGGDCSMFGFVLMILSALSMGVGNIIAKKVGNINMLALVVWGSAVAWPPLLVISIFYMGFDKIMLDLQGITWETTAAIMYIVYLATLFGFGSWNWLLLHNPLNKVVPFTLLVPFIGVFSSVILFNELLQSWKIIAGGLVIAGLGMNLLGSLKSDRKKLLTVCGTDDE